MSISCRFHEGGGFAKNCSLCIHRSSCVLSTLDCAAGEAKVWFPSAESFARVLSHGIRALLGIIASRLRAWRNLTRRNSRIFPGHRRPWSATASFNSAGARSSVSCRRQSRGPKGSKPHKPTSYWQRRGTCSVTLQSAVSTVRMRTLTFMRRSTSCISCRFRKDRARFCPFLASPS